MIRVRLVVEGPTEESFVKNVLAPTLWSRQIDLIPIILGPPGHQGGNTSYARVKGDVLLALKQERRVYCTTMLDFYGLGEGYPGFPLAPSLSNTEKVERIERAMKEDFIANADILRPDIRFIPYLQLHEYEGLLFSDPERFASGIGQQHLAAQFRSIRDSFATPEDINDDPNTAPSKRVLQACQAYRKVIHGTQAAQSVGIEAMRRECPHFRGWVERLEVLGVIS
jgi:hypothetical protein